MKMRDIMGILAGLLLSTPATAATILVLNGNSLNSLVTPLENAGFNVVSDALNPGVIDNAADSIPDLSQIWVWNDGSLGNTNSAAMPARAFSDADRSALERFNAGRNNWVFDGLSWRNHGNTDEQLFSQNIALNLEAAGGGIVLGADDASGDLIVQHVNQVAEWFNFNLFTGVYRTLPSSQVTGGTFFTSPHSVDATMIVGTTTYAEVPHGSQANGLFLSTAVFGAGTPYLSFGSPTLPDEEFNGTIYPNVNHLVTTNLPGGGIDPPPVPIPPMWLGFGLALGIVAKSYRRS